ATLSKLRSAQKHQVTKELDIIASSILDYLNSRDRLEDVRSLYLNPNSLLPSEKLTPKNVSLELGIPYLDYTDRALKKSTYSAYYRMTADNLPIGGYSHMIHNIRLSIYGTFSYSFEIKGMGSFTARYIQTTRSFEITQKGLNTPIYKAYMPDLIQKLSAGSKDTLQVNPKLTTQTTNGLTLQVIFTEATGIINNQTSPYLDSLQDLSCIVLIQRTPKK
ncbi:MAG: hypothetical protein Q8R43_02950, partial [Alphaproteobacteria bacterium]|nr:hypothetical protein [Alphaproteobacteria bacterium]